MIRNLSISKGLVLLFAEKSILFLQDQKSSKIKRVSFALRRKIEFIFISSDASQIQRGLALLFAEKSTLFLYHKKPLKFKWVSLAICRKIDSVSISSETT